MVKVAVAAEEESLKGKVGAVQIDGMAPFWVLVETRQMRVMDNRHNMGLELRPDPGREMIRQALQLAPAAIIASRIGPGAFAELKEAGVKAFMAPEGITAEAAVEGFVSGRLKAFDSPSHAHGTHRRDGSGRFVTHSG